MEFIKQGPVNIIFKRFVASLDGFSKRWLVLKKLSPLPQPLTAVARENESDFSPGFG
jgi:hypothetical protein